MTDTKRFINYPLQLLYNMMASLERSRKKGVKPRTDPGKNMFLWMHAEKKRQQRTNVRVQQKTIIGATKIESEDKKKKRNT